jgi:bacterial translation initiation factor 3 (bIF-3)
VVSLTEALRLAEQHDVDLVEIAPTASPPVCRLMDYGKFKYEEQKKNHEARAKQKQIQIKEVKFRRQQMMAITRSSCVTCAVSWKRAIKAR